MLSSGRPCLSWMRPQSFRTLVSSTMAMAEANSNHIPRSECSHVLKSFNSGTFFLSFLSFCLQTRHGRKDPARCIIVREQQQVFRALRSYLYPQESCLPTLPTLRRKLVLVPCSHFPALAQAPIRQSRNLQCSWFRRAIMMIIDRSILSFGVRYFQY